METNEQYQQRVNAEATQIYEYSKLAAIRNMPHHGIDAGGQAYSVQKETLRFAKDFINQRETERKELLGAFGYPVSKYWYDVKEAFTAMYVPAKYC